MAFLFPFAARGGSASIPRPDRGLYRAERIREAIVVDGALDEAAWQGAPPIDGFTQRDPDEGKPATEPTSVRVLYDDDAIYIGAILEDSHRVTTLLGRRDSSLESDWFKVYLDPHHDRRTGAGFGVNPSNVQIDMVLYNDNWDDWDWDAVWSSATRTDAKGWTAEIRIPYSQLRFPNREVHVWGINFSREIARNNEVSRLVFTPKTEAGFVSRFADLEGIRGIEPKRALELMPYAVTRVDYRETVEKSDPFRSTSEWDATGGLDLKWGVTSNLTLTGTINPDFGQVEVDPAEVNLSQYELFYPEKRPFFLEGGNLFEFGHGGSNNNFNINNFPPMLFYSRRIGRAPQGTSESAYDFIDAPGETTILGAAKLTGKTGNGWSIAALDAVTQEERATFRLGSSQREATIEPGTNYLVTRLAKDLGSKGRIGALVTAVNRNLDASTDWMREEAYLAGVDGHWFFGDRDTILEWFLAGTSVRGSEEAIGITQSSAAHRYQRPDATHIDLDPGRASLEGWGGRVTVAKQRGKWRYNVQAQGYSPGFETNDVGYLQRADQVATHAALLFQDPEPRGRIRRRGFWVAEWQNYNFDGDLISRGIGGSGDVTLTNYTGLWMDLFHVSDRLDDRATRGGPMIRQPEGWSTSAGFNTDERKKVMFEGSAGIEEGGEESWERTLSASIRYRPTPALSLSIGPSYSTSDSYSQYVTQWGDASATATYGNRYLFSRIAQKSLELSTRLEWTFSSRLSLQMYVQPYIASGDYYGFKEVARPHSLEYRLYGTGGSTIGQDGNVYTVDPDGAGAAMPFRFGDPDFNYRSVRGSAVLRWEFRPGSSMYVVWNENREDAVTTGTFDLSRDVSALADVASDDVLMVKMSYWFGR